MPGNRNVRFGGPITPMVKKLMIINGAVFIFQQFVGLVSPQFMESIFGLTYQCLVNEIKIWQIFTNMFLHGGWLHIIFNLIALWMFAGELEQIWGGPFFLKYYLYTGTGAGIFIALMNFYIHSKYAISPVTIGASGAVYAILLAYGMTWPDRKVLVYFLIPVKIKYLVIAFGLIEFFGTLSSATGAGTNISHIGHLGGLLSGLIYLMVKVKKSGGRGFSRSAPDHENIISETIRKAKLNKKKKEIDSRIEAKRIIDELLEKIARNGMSSLTADEKKKLEWARNHYYPDNRDMLH